TSLQRTANRRFGFSAAHTLEVAQALYERHKVLTYPRTDSRHLSSDVAAELPPLFAALASIPDYAPFAQVLVDRRPTPARRIVDDTKVGDHHAIIPTAKPARLASLDRDEARIYDLVVRRFLGAFFPDAEFAITEAWIRVGPGTSATPRFPDESARSPSSTAGPSPTSDAREPQLVDALPPPPDRYLARGRVRIAAGWQEVAGIGGDAAVAPSASAAQPREADVAQATLPPLVEGQRLDATFAHIAKQTTPPARYTEATLLGAMESAGKTIDDEALRAAMKDRGLGTPATRASIIETLLRRAYIVRDRQSLVPTPMGIALVDALLVSGPVASLASPELTGAWEARLAAIARGEESRAVFMADIARYVSDAVAALRGAAPPSAPPPGSSPAQQPAWGRKGKRGGKWGGKGRRSGRGNGRAWDRKRGGTRGATATSEAPDEADADIDVRAPGSAQAPKRAPRRAALRSKAAPRSVPAPVVGSAVDLSCPTCRQGGLIAGARGWGCARWREGCRFVVWFETAGRRVSAAQLRDLVMRGKTRKATFEPEPGVSREGRLVLDAAASSGAARFEPS
ncbi:MAG TPA: DNA topoisomerase, partial [Kofleriaceae bacterium]|nr:DNA topoisomerase [Kofleriaceae bacterium]